MLDFTSALYLGMVHPTRELRPWAQLTLGSPAALRQHPDSFRVAAQLARLQGCEAVTLGPSTLHLFWDLFGMLTRTQTGIYLDGGTYAIARWGTERAAAGGVPVHRFRHRDVGSLRRTLDRRSRTRRPVVVADGMCTGCGCQVPVAAYLECVREVGGLLVIDDTQALGILGARPDPAMPYGFGGGGSLRHGGIDGPDVIVISSLAKGFGAPVAALSGASEIVRQFEAQSETRVYCSPPTAAALRATEHALHLNEARGDTLREQLFQRVTELRRWLGAVRLSATGGIFPIQGVRLPRHLDASRLHRRLLSLGVRTVLWEPHERGGAQIGFVITALHRADQISRAVRTLAAAIDMRPRSRLDGHET